jgi:hypothetical protein
MLGGNSNKGQRALSDNEIVSAPSDRRGCHGRVLPLVSQRPSPSPQRSLPFPSTAAALRYLHKPSRGIGAFRGVRIKTDSNTHSLLAPRLAERRPEDH